MRGVLSIQHVHLHWDKSARGTPWSTVRNALPRELEFIPPRPSGVGWYQRVEYQQRASFVPTTAYHALEAIEKWRLPIATRIEGADHLWLRSLVAQMRRPSPDANKWIARLPFGHRVTLRSNYKSDGDHDRWYFEDVIHVAWSDHATLNLPVFRVIDERQLLY